MQRAGSEPAFQTAPASNGLSLTKVLSHLFRQIFYYTAALSWEEVSYFRLDAFLGLLFLSAF